MLQISCCKSSNITSERTIAFKKRSRSKQDGVHLAIHVIILVLLHITDKVECAGPITFCYDDPTCSPDNWAQYSSVCQYGNLQSPINFERAKVKKIQKSVNLVLSKEYAYRHSSFILQNHGTTVSLALNPEGTSPCLVKGKGFLPNEPYFFSSLHFHWGPDDVTGSEHTIDGKSFPLELHMIHKQSTDWNKLAVFGIFYQIAENDNPVLAPIIDNLNQVRNFGDVSSIAPPYTVNLTDLIPKKIKVFRYHGSLTTPTCDEIVTWTVFDDIQYVSRRQIMEFRQLLGMTGIPVTRNYRPVQPTYTTQRKNVYYMKSIAGSAKKNG